MQSSIHTLLRITFTHSHAYTQMLSHNVTGRRLQKLLRREVFTHTHTHKCSYMTRLLHSQTFTHTRSTAEILTPKQLPGAAFAQMLLHTNTPLDTEAATHRSCYTQKLLHTNAFAHRCFYTQKLLRAGAFTQRNL